MKTLITLALLALSFNVMAQEVVSQKRNPDGTISTTYSDGYVAITKGRERPENPAVMEKVRADHAVFMAYVNSEEYLKESCERERSSFTSHYMVWGTMMFSDHDLSDCAKYRQVKRERKARERAEAK